MSFSSSSQLNDDESSPSLTTGIIRKLPIDVIHRIAAGEVVQRPSAALKELLENAIDANASNVHVSCSDGGLSALQVRDDGDGIHVDDFPLLCERYATSKLKEFSDLEKISTFGFRGEALASLSYVGRVEITSKRRVALMTDPSSSHSSTETSTEVGWKGYFSEGKLLGSPPLQPCAANVGTTVRVEHLFANIPTRRAALKPSEEWSRIIDVVTRYAFAFPKVGFSCWRDTNGEKLRQSASSSSMRKSFASSFAGASSRRRRRSTSPSAVSTAAVQTGISFPSHSTTLQNIRLAYGSAVASQMRLFYHIPNAVVSDLLLRDENSSHFSKQQHHDKSACSERLRALLSSSLSSSSTSLTSPSSSPRGLSSNQQEDILSVFVHAASHILSHSASDTLSGSDENDASFSFSIPFAFSGYTSSLTLQHKAVGGGNESGSGRSSITLFINFRLVDHPGIRRLIESIYAPLLSSMGVTGVKPVTILFLVVPGYSLDVNMHPTKKEVGLLYEDIVLSQLGAVLRETLLRSAQDQQVDMMKLSKQMKPGSFSSSSQFQSKWSAISSEGSASHRIAASTPGGGGPNLDPSTMVRVEEQRGALDSFLKMYGSAIVKESVEGKGSTSIPNSPETSVGDHIPSLNSHKAEAAFSGSSYNQRSTLPLDRKKNTSIQEMGRSADTLLLDEGKEVANEGEAHIPEVLSMPKRLKGEKENDEESRNADENNNDISDNRCDCTGVAWPAQGISTISTGRKMIERPLGTADLTSTLAIRLDDEEEEEDNVIADFRRFQATQRGNPANVTGAASLLPSSEDVGANRQGVCSQGIASATPINWNEVVGSEVRTGGAQVLVEGNCRTGNRTTPQHITLGDKDPSVLSSGISPPGTAERSVFQDTGEAKTVEGTECPSSASAGTPVIPTQFECQELLVLPNSSSWSSMDPRARPPPPLLTSVSAIVYQLNTLCTPSAEVLQEKMCFVGVIDEASFLLQYDLHLLVVDSRQIAKEFVFQSIFRRWAATRLPRQEQYRLLSSLSSPAGKRSSSAPANETLPSSFPVDASVLPPPPLCFLPMHEANTPTHSDQRLSVSSLLYVALGRDLMGLAAEKYISDELIELLLQSGLSSEVAEAAPSLPSLSSFSSSAFLTSSSVSAVTLKERQRIIAIGAAEALTLLFEPFENDSPIKTEEERPLLRTPAPKKTTVRFVRRLTRRLIRWRHMLALYFGIRISIMGILEELPQEIGNGWRSIPLPSSVGEQEAKNGASSLCFWLPNLQLVPLLLLRLADCVPYPPLSSSSSSSLVGSEKTFSSQQKEEDTPTTTPPQPMIHDMECAACTSSIACDDVSREVQSPIKDSRSCTTTTAAQAQQECAEEVRCLTTIGRHIAEVLYGIAAPGGGVGDGSEDGFGTVPFSSSSTGLGWRANNNILHAVEDTEETLKKARERRLRRRQQVIDAVQHGLFPCLKQKKLFKLPSECLANGTIQHIVSVDTLYKVFERC